MQHGIVVSITERYGFVRTDDGVSHHFSPRSMAKGESYADLAIGKAVAFTPAAGPKGMKAANVAVVPAFDGWSIGQKFVIKRSDDHSARPVQAHTEYMHPLQSQWYKSPSQAKDELIDVAKQAGANCILEMDIHKRTFSEGNYQYTMHSFSGLAGVYFNPSDLPTKREADSSFASSVEYSQEVHAKLLTVAQWLNDQRKRQESGGVGWFFALIALMVILFSLSKCS